MKIFLAGIIQGSNAGTELHEQTYRERLKAIIRAHSEGIEVVCPVELHPNSIEYSLDEAQRTFLAMIDEASSADIVVAYLPQASMGTAVEMWEATHAGRVVLTITPLRHNWVVNLLSERVFAGLEEFATFVNEGGLESVLDR